MSFPEYQHLIEKYQTTGMKIFAQHLRRDQWGDVGAARAFLERYWLKAESWSILEPRAQLVFGDAAVGPVDPTFPSSFRLRAMIGGCLFVERDWAGLRTIARASGDDSIIVVEKAGSAEPDDPAIRLRFPVSACWNDLMSGNFVSSVVFEMPYKEYLVFGYSGSWGMFSATEHQHPFNVIGSTADLYATVRGEFTVPSDEAERVRSWLPASYVAALVD